MRINAVYADGEYLYIEFLKVFIANGYMGNLRRSYKCKIPGIKTKYDPFSFIILQCNLFDLALMEGLGSKGWCLFCN